MPRLTERKRLLRDLRRAIEKRERGAVLRELLSDYDSSEDELDVAYAAAYDRVLSRRYVTRGASYRKRSDRWEKLLRDLNYLNDTEFLAHFRIQRPAFFRLVQLVKDDPVFKSNGTKPFRGGAELHMLVLLKFLGTSGNDNSGVKEGIFLGLGSGTVHDYLARATKAVLKLKDTAITWPDAIERKEIARRIQAKYDFVNCVGMVDGTQLPLAFKPSYKGEDFYNRKASYSVNALITCDDVARVRNIVVGWPGSVHDNRVWTNSPLFQRSDSHFNHNEYLLGDSAFQTSAIMVPAFKKPPKGTLHPDKEFFNKKLAKARIKTEHCNGLIKTRFQYLTDIRMRLTKQKKRMRRLIQRVTCACILHNLLISEPVPSEWRDAIKRNGKSPASQPVLDDNDELNAPVSGSDGGERRTQLLCYLLETRA